MFNIRKISQKRDRMGETMPMRFSQARRPCTASSFEMPARAGSSSDNGEAVARG
jgi:hypothetical protein